jgi:plasmid stabilization system protein ParE
MKEYCIEYSSLASTDLADIWEYINGYDNNTANEFVLDIQEKIQQLVTFPFSGAMKQELEEIEEDARFLVFKKYNIIYEVLEETKIVFILRILHGSREIKNYL